MPKLKLRKSEYLDDWYLIERAEHDGRTWWEHDEFGASYMCDSRLGNADIEGPLHEIVEVAKAVKERKSISFRRCAVMFDGNNFFFSSPRNSEEETLVPVSIEDADELADEVLAHESV